jgi:hypothetical protein
MDGPTFDAIVKRLGASPSRRRVLKGLTGGLVAGLAMGLGRHPVDAKPKPCGPEEHRCKNGKCQKCCFDRQCPRGQTCLDGACTRGACLPIPSLGGTNCTENDQCCSNVCQNGGCCNALTHYCVTDDDCCSGHCENETCRSTTATCSESEGPCGVPADCCPGLFCSSSSRCSTCLGEGANCQDNTDSCCAGTCAGICVCIEETGACTKDEDCCSSTCNGEHCVCRPAQTPCASFSSCCAGLFCLGTCCVPGNGPCTVAADCCNGGCTGGKCPCTPPQGTCLNDGECCSGSCFNSSCF